MARPYRALPRRSGYEIRRDPLSARDPDSADREAATLRSRRQPQQLVRRLQQSGDERQLLGVFAYGDERIQRESLGYAGEPRE